MFTAISFTLLGCDESRQFDYNNSPRETRVSVGDAQGNRLLR